MGKIGWAAIYAANVLVAAPILAGAAALGVGAWLAEVIRDEFGHPDWNADHRADEQFEHRLGDVVSGLERRPS